MKNEDDLEEVGVLSKEQRKIKNKEDWEEIEKSDRTHEYKDMLKYGVDFSKINKDTSSVKAFVKAINVTSKWVKIGLFILGIIVLYYAVHFTNIALANVKTSFYTDVKGNIEETKFCKIKLISKDVVKAPGYKNENGIYYFEIRKCPDVKFTAIKDWGIDYNDYDENFQKYLFNNWVSDEKKYFKTEEYIQSNGLLWYRNYIEISNYEELEQATEYLIHYLEYAENWNKETKVIKDKFQKKGQFSVVPIANIYIRINGEPISLYSSSRMTANEIRDQAKILYLNNK